MGESSCHIMMKIVSSWKMNSLSWRGACLISCFFSLFFSWLCGAATGAVHTGYSIEGHICARYTKDKEKNLECARVYLWRFMHYHSRYKVHTASKEAEVHLKEKLKMKISELETGEPASQDLSWVEKGIYTLFQSRRILSYSYPFAYYMFGHDLFQNEMTKEKREIKQNLFEDQQQQIEAYVEKLSLVLEEPFKVYDKDEFAETRMKVICLSKVVDNLCRAL